MILNPPQHLILANAHSLSRIDSERRLSVTIIKYTLTTQDECACISLRGPCELLEGTHLIKHHRHAYACTCKSVCVYMHVHARAGSMCQTPYDVPRQECKESITRFLSTTCLLITLLHDKHDDPYSIFISFRKELAGDNELNDNLTTLCSKLCHHTLAAHTLARPAVKNH